jgi:hypothetical protein
MDMQFNQEYIEGETPNYSIEELNDHELNKDNEPFQTHAIISKAQHGVPVPEIEDKYEEIINKYEYKFMPIKEENYNEKYDKKFNRLKEKENILKKYNDLKAQVDLIEKDLNFYKENKDKYKSIVPIETSIEELNKVKYIINYIESSRNLEKFKKIEEIQQKFNLKVNEENYDILNKKLFKDLNEQLDDRLNKMNKLKNENPSNINNFEYELFLSPAKEKIDQLKQLDELMININKIEEKIGKWNFNNKKNTIVSMLEDFKKKFIFNDKATKKEFIKKFDVANTKLEEIRQNYKELYDKIEEDKIDSIINEGIEGKEAEKIINYTIYKMELFKEEHEKGIYISQKLKDLIKKNEELKEKLEEDTLLLDQIKENVENNVNTMKNNIELIKQKIK